MVKKRGKGLDLSLGSSPATPHTQNMGGIAYDAKTDVDR